MSYIMQIKLLSETIIGSGDSIPGSVDTEIVYDEVGLPYIKGKTIKGNLREQVDEIEKLLKLKEEHYSNLFFGKEGIYNDKQSILNISDATLSKNIQLAIKNAVNNKEIYTQEIIQALTNDRAFTKIKDGIAEDKSLRTIRTIDSGLIFQVEINPSRELTKEEEGILAASVKMFKHIGLMRTRGKGYIECSLWKDNNNITEKSINNLKKGMKL